MNRSPLSSFKRIATVASGTLLGSLLALACSSRGLSASPDMGPASPEAPQAAAGTSALTYFKDVKPIVDAKCVQCHAAGGIAPFSLTNFDEVKPHAAAMKSAVASRIMPPWLATQGCNDYKGDISLSDEQIKTIATWADGQTPMGNEKDYVAPAAAPDVKMARIDRTLSLAEPYTPSKSPDDYRCFILDWPETQQKFVTGFTVHPDHPAIVHHAIAYVARPEQVAAYQKLDDAEPGQGYTCFGGPGGTAPQFLAGWAPGGGSPSFPDGTGIKVEPGSKIVLQIHYNTSSAPAVPDATTIAMKLDDQVEKEAAVLPFTNPSWVLGKTMTIPARMQNVSHSFSADPSPALGRLTSGLLAAGDSFTIYASNLHMHTRGVHTALSIDRQAAAPAESPANANAEPSNTCLLNIDKWNFHWQRSYPLAKPTTFHPGDKLSLECRWDNDLDHDLNWGEGTGDEMCVGFLYVTK
jgi:hypothetical protein